MYIFTSTHTHTHINPGFKNFLGMKLNLHWQCHSAVKPQSALSTLGIAYLLDSLVYLSGIAY